MSCLDSPAHPRCAAIPDELRHLVWRGDASLVAAPQEHGAVWPSGHAVLDAELPGGGWPASGLTELLQPARVHAEWSLLAFALSQALRRQAGPCVLVRPAPPPATPGLVPFAPGLQALGLPPERLLWVGTTPPEAQLWACEQALQCADVVAVLAWLGPVRSDDLRRLHRIASTHHKPLFVMRADACTPQATQPSPAPLRVQLLQAWPLRVRLLKRRGAPLLQVLELARNDARLGLRRRPAPVEPVMSVEAAAAAARLTPARSGARDALDRPVAA
ncbi:MAG: translesion DNA synthesis-associated protein ImuA [Burkholderiaceae bacterium]